MTSFEGESPEGGIDPQAALVAAQIASRFSKSNMAPWQEELVSHMHLVLVGYDEHGAPMQISTGIQQTRQIEKQLIIDPQKIAEELAKIRSQGDQDMRDKMSSESSSFSAEGGHAFLNTNETLARVRREGWIILAGLRNDSNEFVPVGYNYGLDQMPNAHGHGDHEFSSLDYGTLTLSDHTHRLGLIEPNQTAVNWRTSILPYIKAKQFQKTLTSVPSDMDLVPIRRLGIGSALKYAITALALRRGQTNLSFNIGTIYEYGSEISKKVRLRNTVSYDHNRQIFSMEPAGEGYRNYSYALELVQDRKKHPGIRNFVATIFWYARMPELKPAMERMRSGITKLTKWNIHRLEEEVEIMHSRIREEVNAGNHKHFD